MLPVGVAGGDGGVVKGEFRALVHAEFFHDVAGGGVADGGDGDEFGQLEFRKGVMDEGAGAFGGEALVVEGAVEAPADFDGGLGEVGNDGVHGLEAEDADEAAGGAVLGDEEGEAVAGELVGVAGDRGVGFGGGVGGSEVIA